MTFWHVAIIVMVLGAGEGEIEIRLPFKDEWSCGDAIPLLAEAARIDYPESYVVCQPTTLLSGVTVRPIARPEEE